MPKTTYLALHKRFKLSFFAKVGHVLVLSGSLFPFCLTGVCVAFGRSSMFNQTLCMAKPDRSITAPRHAKMSTNSLVISGVTAWLRLRPPAARLEAKVRLLSKYSCKMAEFMT